MLYALVSRFERCIPAWFEGDAFNCTVSEPFPPQRLFVKSHGQHMGVPVGIEEIRGKQAVRFIRLGQTNRSNLCSVSQG